MPIGNAGWLAVAYTYNLIGDTAKGAAAKLNVVTVK